MTTKLTLTIDDSVVDKAKKYARRRNVSLSKLVEFYFSLLISATAGDSEALPPITSELSGIAKNIKISDYKDVLADALIKKYL